MTNEFNYDEYRTLNLKAYQTLQKMVAIAAYGGDDDGTSADMLREFAEAFDISPKDYADAENITAGNWFDIILEVRRDFLESLGD